MTADDRVLWNISRQELTLFLPREERSVTVQIQNRWQQEASLESAGNMPSDTILLIDHSLSIPEEDRDKQLQLAQTLIYGAGEDEKLTLACFGTDVQFLVRESDSKEDLLRALDGMVYLNQYSYLGEAVKSTLEEIGPGSDENIRLRRLILFTDGSDDQDIPYLPEEIMELLEGKGILLHVIGSRYESSFSGLQRWMNLARKLGGEACLLDEEENMESLKDRIDERSPKTTAKVMIPEEFLDGETRQVLIRCLNGTEEHNYKAAVSFPFGAVKDQTDNHSLIYWNRNLNETGETSRIVPEIQTEPDRWTEPEMQASAKLQTGTGTWAEAGAWTENEAWADVETWTENEAWADVETWTESEAWADAETWTENEAWADAEIWTENGAWAEDETWTENKEWADAETWTENEAWEENETWAETGRSPETGTGTKEGSGMLHLSGSHSVWIFLLGGAVLSAAGLWLFAKRKYSHEGLAEEEEDSDIFTLTEPEESREENLQADFGGRKVVYGRKKDHSEDRTVVLGMNASSGGGEVRRYRVILEEEGGGMFMECHMTQEAVIGRNRECALAVAEDPSISGRHCRIFEKEGQIWIEDLDSSNGTFLNSQRVSRAEKIRPGDLLEIGRKRFRVKTEKV